MHNLRNRGLYLGLLVAAGFPSASYANNVVGRWGQQFGMPVIPLHATLLPDGQVFSFGTDGNGNQGAQFEYAIWNFWGGWGAQAKLPNQTATDTFCAATSLLPDGNVLVAGGDTRNPYNNGVADALILNSGAKTLERTAYMANARWYPSLTTLPNGESLIHGGVDGAHNPVAVPEIYANGQWRTLWGANSNEIINNDGARWFYPRNFVAPDGRVFGMTDNMMYYLDWAGQGAIQVAGYLPNKTRGHQSTAVMYQPGKILQVGGTTAGDFGGEASRQGITVDITGGAPQVEGTPDMAFRRMWVNSTVLPNGEVLVTGGSAFDNKLIDTANTAEMWNPNTRQFRQLATAATARMYHSVALLLPDASVMVGGGGAPGPLNNLNAEIYYPPYLFNGNEFADRPTIGEFNNQQGYNNLQNVPNGGAGGVARVTLVREGSVTHSFDVGQRFLDLAFQNQGNGTINVSMPPNANLAPPGFYMLFLINEAGVPSYARILNLNGGNPTNNGALAAPAGAAAPAPVLGPVVVPVVDNHAAPAVVENGAVYTLVSRHSNKCVDVPWASLDDGVQVQQAECNGGNAQKFRIVALPNAHYNLVNVNSEKCIEVADAGNANGSKIAQHACNGSEAQQLKINDGTAGSKQILFVHSNKCFDIAGPSVENGAVSHQWDCYPGLDNQEFFLKP
ncbi:MAG: RICIN domain-containing protein [Oligoflexus sp.]|nr:RICIN domain-containing protein [Oligoflexus sp.]